MSLMDLKLPDSFDVVICGTGLTESMVAACLSRVGKKILHVDRNDYYGGPWATFTFESLIKWIKKYEPKTDAASEADIPVRLENEVPKSDVCIRNVVIRSYIPEKNKKDVEILNGHIHEHKKNDVDDADGGGGEISQPLNQNNPHDDESQEPETDLNDKDGDEFKPAQVPLTMVSQARIRQNFDDISLDDFLVLSRKFNLDITTKFLFSAGPLVNAIIKANISHYAEFKVVNRILTWKDDQIVEVPCNRSDVFGSGFLAMIEKRVLMKFLTSCVEMSETDDEMKAFQGKPFKEFLESRKLSENLQKFVIYSIALVKPDTPTELALKETSKFLRSLGRYGKSPFIWPLYGTGELPQAFCRMSAVFGGTYCLNINIESMDFNRETGKVRTCMDGHTIESDHLVMDNSYVPYGFNAHMSGKMISRGILITNQSMLPTAEEHLSFLTIPPLLGHEESVRVVEIGPASSACPSGLFILYLACPSSYATAEEDLLQYTTLLTAPNDDQSNKPKLLWSVYFNQLEDIIFDDIPPNVFIPSLPDSSLGFELAVEEAKKIFHSICPDEEFMLAVPNSEDIIWGTESSEDATKTSDAVIDAVFNDASKGVCDVDGSITSNNIDATSTITDKTNVSSDIYSTAVSDDDEDDGVSEKCTICEEALLPEEPITNDVLNLNGKPDEGCNALEDKLEKVLPDISVNRDEISELIES